MAFSAIRIFLSLTFLQSNVWPVHTAKHVRHPSHGNHFFREVEANIVTNASLWAPYYRIITAEEARMIPIGVPDLGPRAGECQCRAPDGMNIYVILW